MKVRSTSRLIGATAAIFAGLTLAACGGGGGGSSSGSNPPVSSPPPPPPPPPSANVAPTAQATATPASPQEGQPFSLDASASTDPEGAALTYTWSQISGPLVTLGAPNQAALQLTAAEVTEDTEAVFRVIVSDGTLSSTADVSLNFENIAQTPNLITPYTYYSTTPLPFRPVNWGTVHPGLQILGAEEIPGGDISFYGVYRDSQSTEFALSFRKAIERSFQQPLATKLVSYVTLISGQHFWVVDSEGSHIYGQPPDNSDELTLLQETSHQNACSTTQLVIERWLIVGRRNAGFELYENGWGIDTATQYPPPPPAHNPVRQKGFTTTNSICGIHSTYFSVDRSVFDSPYGLQDLISLLTYNLDTHSLELYSQKAGVMNPEIDAFELTQSVRADFKSVNNLELVDHMIAENALLLLFSDGEHNGDHRLIVAGLDDNRNIIQSTYEWEIGAPAGFGKYSFLTANPVGSEIVIFAPSSPQAIVFKPNDPFDWFGSLDGPYFFEVGLGASTGGYLGLSVGNNQAIATLHPDKQELKLFVSPPY